MSHDGYSRARDESFAEFVDGSIAKMWSQAPDGIGRDELEVHMRVTDLTDGQVEIVRQRAGAQGFAGLVLVDEREPPRPGTVSSAGLEPYAVAVLDQATQARRSAARHSPVDMGSGSASTDL